MNSQDKKLVCPSEICTGCRLCEALCHSQAVTVISKLSGYEAVIDPMKCIECGLCHKKCIASNRAIESRAIEPKAYQGWCRDTAIRANSSSGGVATALAKCFIDRGGKVVGCHFAGDEFRLDLFDDIDEYMRVCSGSKYANSSSANIYERCKRELQHGTKVLFIGLPCQVAAVKSYVGINLQAGLITIDLICHGTPTKKLFSDYIADYTKEPIRTIKFRKKENFYLSVNGGSRNQTAFDEYTRCFLDAVDYADGCYRCNYANVNRIGDITLGDSWGSELPKEERASGISLVICSSQKGKELLDEANLELFSADLEKAKAVNGQLVAPSKPDPKREKFLSLMQDKNLSFAQAAKRCYLKDYFVVSLKNIIRHSRLYQMYRRT